MAAFPLKSLAFYKVKTIIQPGIGSDGFIQDQVIQYIKSISDIHGMEEVIEFKDWALGKTLIWRIHSDELFDHWNNYLEPTDNPLL